MGARRDAAWRGPEVRLVSNPWLDIPLADYEGHMASPQVAQAQLLADELQRAVRHWRPRRPLVLGCAGGNGFERLDPGWNPRVIGIDINPEYIAAARDRFGSRFLFLELYVDDIQDLNSIVEIAPVDLVFAGLIFEYVDLDRALCRIKRLLAPGGVLVAVLQLPCEAGPVTPTPFTSLGTLARTMKLVPVAELVRVAAKHGFSAGAARTVRAAGGKDFAVQTLRTEFGKTRSDD
jgi:SAM-dependent methyltransferase